MSLKIIIVLVLGALLLIMLSTYFLKKGRIPEKYALLWYAMALVLILLAVIPNLFEIIAKTLGFYPMSTFIISIFMVIIILFLMALTIMMAGQKKKTTLLIQEISLQNHEIDKLKRKK